ncbi:hypothetical protein NDU88_000119 [Pleurodeles waltl]|uniref:RRM domain-containing protein n=1 Tax=Pleurodeles waltl TaxID=8319 RepID=A0AAV7KM60_PLEWA|nr:hypothetical protein NDU88_000119 [Pleurodeles waltl]
MLSPRLRRCARTNPRGGHFAGSVEKEMGPEGRARMMEARKSNDLRRGFVPGLNGAHELHASELFRAGHRGYREPLSPDPRSNDRGDVDYREPLLSRSPLRGPSRERYSSLEYPFERRQERYQSPPYRERRPPEQARRRSPRPRSPRRPRSLSPVPRARSRSPPPRPRRGSPSPGRRGSGVTMHPEKRAALRRSCCLKVTNVPPGTLYSALWARFKPHAAVLFVEMLRDERAALVYVSEPEERERLLVEAERLLERGMRLEAWEGGSAALPAEPLDEAHPRADRTLLVANLDKQLSRKDLRAAFRPFGPIVDVEIRRLPRAAAYYALLQLASVRGACRALREMDGAPLGGLPLRCCFGRTPPGPCVCARGLARDLSGAYIQQRFGRYGAVDKVAYNPLMGAALVLFRSTAEAEAAVRDLRARPAEGVSLDFADEHYQLFFCKGMQARGLDTGDFLFL